AGIAEHLLHATNVPGAPARRLSPAAIAALKEYAWRGNGRALRNIIGRAKILCDQQEVHPEHLSFPVGAGRGNGEAPAPQGTIAEVAWRMIQDALRRQDRKSTRLNSSH